jgi:branched-chain amino acid transport system ATP-binding protein
MLEVSQLRGGYGSVEVLRGLSFTVNAGQVFTVIGANGAGKSTLLRMISGLVRPSGGKIRLDGEDVTRKSAQELVRRGLVHVPEGRHVFPDMSVLDNLHCGAYPFRRQRTVVGRRLEEVFGILPELADRRDMPAGLMSGGQQQMLVIGRALMAGAPTLLLDEPSQGLAHLVAERVFELIRELARRGRAVLLVEQRGRLALAVSDQALVLESGTAVLQGDARTVAADPTVVDKYLGLEGEKLQFEPSDLLVTRIESLVLG